MVLICSAVKTVVLGFIPQGVLQSYARRCSLRAADLEKFLKNANFPEGARVLVLEGDVVADWRCPGWVCLYEYPFRIGHALPFSSLVRSFLTTFGYALGQLMPTAWWIFRQFDRICVEQGIPVDLADVMFSYGIY